MFLVKKFVKIILKLLKFEKVPATNRAICFLHKLNKKVSNKTKSIDCQKNQEIILDNLDRVLRNFFGRLSWLKLPSNCCLFPSALFPNPRGWAANIHLSVFRMRCRSTSREFYHHTEH